MKTINRPLFDLCLQSIKRINPFKEPEKEFWYVDISSIEGNTKSIESPTRNKGKVASVRARQVIKANDVLVATTRPNLNAVALVPQELHGEICSTGFCVLRCGPELAPEYLYHFVRSKPFVDSLNNLVQGALYPAVTDKQVFAQKIPWVPIENQRQIAARLKAQLAEVEKARKALEINLRDFTRLKAKVLESIFRNTENRKNIGSVAKLQSGYAFKSGTFQKSGIRLLRNTNILPGKVYWSDSAFLSEKESRGYPSYSLNEGDVLISLDRPLISKGIKVAKVGQEDLPALLVQRVGRFILDHEKLDPDYLYAYLQTDLFISKISGHDQSLGVPHISPSQVENIEIPLPELSKQKSFSEKLKVVTHACDSARNKIYFQMRDLGTLPQKLLAQAFTI